MSKTILGTSVPIGYVKGVHGLQDIVGARHSAKATTSSVATNARDYDRESGTIKEKIDGIESRLTALGL